MTALSTPTTGVEPLATGGGVSRQQDAADFTVIIPTYNYGRYLPRAVASVLSQSHGSFELVIADDGSTDGTERYARSVSDERVQYLRQENAGPFAAVQAAFSRTSGKWVVVFDADDELLPGALASLHLGTKEPGVRAVVGPWVSIGCDGQRRAEPFSGPSGNRTEDFKGVLTGRLRFATGAAAILRGAIERYAGWRAPVRHGIEIMIFAHLAHDGGLVVTREPLLAVHDHPGRLRDDLPSIVSAGTGLVEGVFDPAFVGEEARGFKPAFTAFMERERARTFYRSGCHGDSARAFERALRASPRVALDGRGVRRYLVSKGLWALGRGGLPVQVRADAVSRKRRDVPVPMTRGGTLRHFKADPFGTVLAASRTCGDVALLQLWAPTYLLSHPDDMRHVLVANSYNYERTRFAQIKRLFGGGLIGDEGASHLSQRRLCQPFYTPRAAGETIAPAAECLRRITSGWRDGQEVNVAAELLRLNVGLSGLTVLGIDSQATSEELFEQVNKTLMKGVKIMACPVHLPESLPLRRHRLYKRYGDRLDRVLGEIIDAHEARGPQEDGDFIDHLLLARRANPAQLDRWRMIEHAKTMFVATSEPTATPTASALWRTVVHPEFEPALVAEARAVLGERDAKAGDAGKLVLTTAFWRESLRLHPSNWLMPRRAVKDDTLPGGLKVVAGQEVFISQYALHHDERYFRDAERFDPGRFSPEQMSARARGTYMPFGSGARGCIGASLAEQVGVTLLAGLLRDWRFERVEGGDPVMFTPNYFISLIKDSRLLLRVRRRHA